MFALINTESLVKCLRQIKNNREEARQKGRNGRKLYVNGYNWEAMEKKLHALLDEMTSTWK